MNVNLLPGHLPSSEFILTDRGTIYHLDLPPEALADTIITVGDPARVAAVSRHFDSISHRAQHREFITHCGRIGEKSVMVVSTGIGTGNIDIVVNELDALANVDFEKRVVKDLTRSLRIIRLGTCGALQKNLEPGSWLASSFAIGLDNLMHYYKRELNPDEHFILEEFARHTRLQGTAITPYIAEGAISLRRLLPATFEQGITVTCPGFYGPQGRTLRVAPAYQNLISSFDAFESRGQQIKNLEMETSALYGLGKLLGHACLSVSLVVANRVSQTFIKDADTAMERMIQASVGCIFP